MMVQIYIDWGLINPKLYYLDWGVWHIVPLGDVGQHTLPCSVKSVPGRPCRRTPELDPGRGRGMGAILHLGGAGSERGVVIPPQVLSGGQPANSHPVRE